FQPQQRARESAVVELGRNGDLFCKFEAAGFDLQADVRLRCFRRIGATNEVESEGAARRLVGRRGQRCKRGCATQGQDIAAAEHGYLPGPSESCPGRVARAALPGAPPGGRFIAPSAGWSRRPTW